MGLPFPAVLGDPDAGHRREKIAPPFSRGGVEDRPVATDFGRARRGCNPSNLDDFWPGGRRRRRSRGHRRYGRDSSGWRRLGSPVLKGACRCRETHRHAYLRRDRNAVPGRRSEDVFFCRGEGGGIKRRINAGFDVRVDEASIARNRYPERHHHVVLFRCGRPHPRRDGHDDWCRRVVGLGTALNRPNKGR